MKCGYLIIIVEFSYVLFLMYPLCKITRNARPWYLQQRLLTFLHSL